MANPYESPSAPSSKRDSRVSLVLLSIAAGASVGLVSYCRYVHGMASMIRGDFTEMLLHPPPEELITLAMEIAWGAATGAVVGLLATLIFCRMKKSHSN
jgi:hypothetical protein